MTGKEKLDKLPTKPKKVVEQFADAIPVSLLRFSEPHNLTGKISCSSVSSCQDDYKSRHVIDWIPSEAQFRIVFHPPAQESVTDWIFPGSVENYQRFDPGKTYTLPRVSLP